MRVTNPFLAAFSLSTSVSASASGSTPKRRARARLIVGVILLVLLWIVWPSPPLPPRYEEWGQERAVMWEGGPYVKFDVPQGTGINHQLQRVLLQHHVAVLGNRSLVFEPYVEDDTVLPFRPTRWPWRSARIPLSAFIAGVVSGFETLYHVPRAVSASGYSAFCPLADTKVVTVKTPENDGDLELASNGQARIHQIQVLLAGSEHQCVRIVGEVFDDAFFDSNGPLEVVDSLVKSPVLQHFTFSTTVLRIVNRLMPKIAPHSAPYDLNRIVQAQGTGAPATVQWKHVLALHLRRGDNWVDTCAAKGEAFAPFAGFNKLPNLPGNENIPPPPDMVPTTRAGLYAAKCYPDITTVIARARRMRKNHPLLRIAYVLTDAPDEWAEEARRWLESDAWEKVVVGKIDAYTGWHDREIGIAVDMEVARRAGVFVGNGFSTTSSNIALLRTRDGLHPDFTQFW